jgi:hypothetical protein
LSAFGDDMLSISGDLLSCNIRHDDW